MVKPKFPIPDGVIEIEDPYQLDLMHFELKNLKPKGTILFSGETKPILFQFIAGETRDEGVVAKISGAPTVSTRQILDHIEKYSRVEALVTITLLQFRVMFVVNRVSVVYHGGQRHLKLGFPTKVLKTHRRKFIRIPFNESFPAFLTFQTDSGSITRRLKDLSREGMRIQLEPGDAAFMVPGYKMKQATLKVLNREMPVGLNVMAVHGSESAGIKMVAISDVDKHWIRDCIRILMGQILGLNDPSLDDQLEKDDPNKKS